MLRARIATRSRLGGALFDVASVPASSTTVFPLSPSVSVLWPTQHTSLVSRNPYLVRSTPTMLLFSDAPHSSQLPSSPRLFSTRRPSAGAAIMPASPDSCSLHSSSYGSPPPSRTALASTRIPRRTPARKPASDSALHLLPRRSRTVSSPHPAPSPSASSAAPARSPRPSSISGLDVLWSTTRIGRRSSSSYDGDAIPLISLRRSSSTLSPPSSASLPTIPSAFASPLLDATDDLPEPPLLILAAQPHPSSENLLEQHLDEAPLPSRSSSWTLLASPPPPLSLPLNHMSDVSSMPCESEQSDGQAGVESREIRVRLRLAARCVP